MRTTFGAASTGGYVLGMLFYRLISENLTAYLNEQERRAGNPDFDYARLSAEEAGYGMAETVNEKGFFSRWGATSPAPSPP